MFVAIGCDRDVKGDVPRSANATTIDPNAAPAIAKIVIAAPKYSVAPNASQGSVTGSVTLKDSIAQSAPTLTGRDSAICGPAMPDGSVQMQNGGLAGVVVWLEGVTSGKAIGLERRLELESVHCSLAPRVQAAVVGSAVNIIGHDAFRQHLRFIAGGETSPRATILIGGGEQVIPTDLPFRSPGLVAVIDTGHVWTRAYLAVFNHPYFAVTGAGGTFTIEGVPAGKYTLRAWHERTGVVDQPVEVGATGQVKVSVILAAK